MANLNLRVSEELKAKFDACAPLYGGRPALLRQLLAKITGPVEAPPPSPKRQDLRTFVRLSADELVRQYGVALGDDLPLPRGDGSKPPDQKLDGSLRGD